MELEKSTEQVLPRSEEVRGEEVGRAGRRNDLNNVHTCE
jgi:hypothetical protein